MALRLTVEAATAWAPFTFTWPAQRHAAPLQHPVDLKIADAELCARQAILVETGPEEAPSFGYVPLGIVRAAVTPSSPRAITYQVQLHPQGTLTLSIQRILLPTTYGIASPTPVA